MEYRLSGPNRLNIYWRTNIDENTEVDPFTVFRSSPLSLSINSEDIIDLITPKTSNKVKALVLLTDWQDLYVVCDL